VRRRIVAIFESAEAAREAEASLRHAGVPQRRITVSIGLTRDAIAAEAPGQSYANQPGQPPSDSPEGSYADAQRSGSCVVTVELDGADLSTVEGVLRGKGARHLDSRSG